MILNLLAGLVLSVNGQTYTGHGETYNYLNVSGSDVTVTDIRVRESGPGTNAITVSGNRVRLSRLVVERAGATGVYFAAGTGSVIEDSVIRDPVRSSGRDSWAIYSATPGLVQVRRNVVYGSGFSTYAPGGSSIIEFNRFVIPEDYRTDCQGRIERDGPCQCGEFGVALKSGNSIIRYNTISGYRRSDPLCGGSGSPGAGIATAACAPFQTCPTDNVVADHNVITDSRFGIYLAPRSTNIRLDANLICRSTEAISDGYATSTIVNNAFFANVTNLSLYGPRSGLVSGNHTATTCK